MADSMFSPAFFNAVRHRSEQYEWAREARECFVQQIKNTLAQPIDIPLLGGGWSHNYNCPNEGDRLVPIDRNHHRCPSCGEVWSGSPWDEVAVANEHWRYAMACRDASILYALNGSTEGLNYGKSVLFFYADHYDSYPLHDRMGGMSNSAGKVQCQTLSESSWLIPLAQACTILKGHGALTDEEQTWIATRLFEPAIRVIKRNPAGMSNWQTYHNAALLWSAVATNNQLLAKEVLNDSENGFLFQMENSLGDDGFWFEGAWGYHFYTLEAQVLIVLAASWFGIMLQDHPRFRAMFRAPLACMLPDGTLPPIHDSDNVEVGNFSYLYEFAFAAWGEGRELVAKSTRLSPYSLLFGAPKLEERDDTSEGKGRWSIQDLKRAGMLFVNNRGCENGKGTAAIIDYGPHGGGHGHRDKLNLLYYAKGHPWLTDAGTVPYGNPMYEQYFKQTVAHNTIRIGGRSQREAEGKLLYAYETEEGFFEFAAEVDTAYSETILRRKLILTEEYLVDLFYVQGHHPQTIEWIMHTEGELLENDLLLEAVPDGSLGNTDGYSYLRSIHLVRPASNPWRMQWQWKQGDDSIEGKSDKLEVYGFPAVQGEELWIAESPAMPSVGKRHALIRRCMDATEALFVTVWRPCSGNESKPLRIGNDGGELQISIGDEDVRSFSLQISETLKC